MDRELLPPFPDELDVAPVTHADPERRSRAWARLAVAFAVAALAEGLLVVADASLAPPPDEAWSLRWLRTLAAHPVRGTMALALLILGLGALLRRCDHD